MLLNGVNHVAILTVDTERLHGSTETSMSSSRTWARRLEPAPSIRTRVNGLLWLAHHPSKDLLTG